MTLLLLFAGLVLLLPVIGLGLLHPLPDRRIAHLSASFLVAMSFLLLAGFCFLLRPLLGWLFVAGGFLFTLLFVTRIFRRERGLAQILAELDNPHLAPEVPRRLRGLLRATHPGTRRFTRTHDEHALYGSAHLILRGMAEEAEETLALVDVEVADRDLALLLCSLRIAAALHEGALRRASELAALDPADPDALKSDEAPLLAPACALVAALVGNRPRAEAWLASDRPSHPGQVFAAMRALAVAHQRAALDQPEEAREALLALPAPALALALRLAHATPGPATPLARAIEVGGEPPYR